MPSDQHRSLLWESAETRSFSRDRPSGTTGEVNVIRPREPSWRGFLSLRNPPGACARGRATRPFNPTSGQWMRADCDFGGAYCRIREGLLQ